MINYIIYDLFFKYLECNNLTISPGNQPKILEIIKLWLTSYTYDMVVKLAYYHIEIS